LRILLTGFEPFNNSSINPSQEVVRRLASYPCEGIELHTAILPVEHRRGPQELLHALEASQPEAVVCLGEAGRACLSIERVAVNLIDDHIPDNAGEQWVDRPVVEGAPAAYFVTLPVKRMLKAVLDCGAPAELSMSAGSFLCNQVAYTLLHHLYTTGRPEVPAGFIHLPRLPEQVASTQLARPETGALPSMSLETQALGIQAAIQILNQR
jgi:pyroglutamyl-peptidase